MDGNTGMDTNAGRMPPEIRAYIGLGSNLHDPAGQLTRAFAALNALPACRLLRRSALYRSRPLGPAGQPDYVNAVAAVATRLGPAALLAALQDIEYRQGRRREGAVRWGPRVLDLDLLLYGEETICSPQLQVPHPELARREFVLYPLQEIAPQLVVPGLGRLAELVRRCPRRGLERLSESAIALHAIPDSPDPVIEPVDGRTQAH